MSLADERARDMAEIIDDEPVIFKWLDAYYFGRRTAAIPEELAMLDAGYESRQEIMLIALREQFQTGAPPLHDTIEVDGVRHKIMKLNRDAGYFKFTLKELL